MYVPVCQMKQRVLTPMSVRKGYIGLGREVHNRRLFVGAELI